MRRLAHILLNAATVLCLVLCVATGVLWVRSYRVGDHFEWQSEFDEGRSSEWRARTVTWGLGEVRVDYRYTRTTGRRTNPTTRSSTFEHREDTPTETYMPIDGPPPRIERFGVVFDLNDFVYSPWEGEEERRFNYLVVCPLWILTSLAALFPAVRASGMLRRQRRTRRGLCPVCGYDVRATPERCPECGRVTTNVARRRA